MFLECTPFVQGNVGSCKLTIAVDVYKCSPRGSLYRETGVLIAPLGDCQAMCLYSIDPYLYLSPDAGCTGVVFVLVDGTLQS